MFNREYIFNKVHFPASHVSLPEGNSYASQVCSFFFCVSIFDDFLRLLLPHHPHGLGEWGGWYLATWEMSQLIDGTWDLWFSWIEECLTNKIPMDERPTLIQQTRFQWNCFVCLFLVILFCFCLPQGLWGYTFLLFNESFSGFFGVRVQLGLAFHFK